MADCAGGGWQGAGLTPEQRRQRDSQAGRHAQAELRARVEREVDPGGALSPEERARRVQAALSEFYAERSKRSASVRAQRKATKPTATKPTATKPTATKPTATKPTEPAVTAVTGEPLVTLGDPEMFEGEEMRAALVARDVTVVYRLLYQAGVSQREIARRTGQSQSEVSDILRGCTVRDVLVLERIADGLGIPRAWMRLDGVAESAEGSYGGEVAGLPEEVIAAMFRRHLLALGAVAVAGSAVVGELLELPGPVPVALPSQLSYAHVGQVRDLTRRLGLAGNPCAAGPEVLSSTPGTTTGPCTTSRLHWSWPPRPGTPTCSPPLCNTPGWPPWSTAISTTG